MFRVCLGVFNGVYVRNPLEPVCPQVASGRCFIAWVVFPYFDLTDGSYVMGLDTTTTLTDYDDNPLEDCQGEVLQVYNYTAETSLAISSVEYVRLARIH